MFCHNCATQLPGDAQFCLQCGTRVAPDTPSLVVRREICEVYRSIEDGGWFRAGDTFWEAIAIGPEGRYSVGRSDTCPRKALGSSKGVKHADILLDQLIKQLIQEGWQPLPRGPEWYSYRFERHVRTAPSPTNPDIEGQPSGQPDGDVNR